MFINITHIDQVYVLQESLAASRSRAASEVLADIARNSRSWPKTGRWLSRPAFRVNATGRRGGVIRRCVERFIRQCDCRKHWRSVSVAEQIRVSLDG